jgi:hypothetical protein
VLIGVNSAAFSGHEQVLHPMALGRGYMDSRAAEAGGAAAPGAAAASERSEGAPSQGGRRGGGGGGPAPAPFRILEGEEARSLH